MDVDRDEAGGGTGSARRRRERRLRAHLRHARMTVAMALAESTHHSAPRGQKMARAGGEARVALHGHVPDAPLPQGRILRHFAGHLPVPSLVVPVPQMVDQLPDIELFFAALSPDPEQVIEVPKILPLDVPMRAALRVTQLVEQLVEVPTTVSYSSLQRTVEQLVDIPVPGGGGPSSGLHGFLPRQSSTASPSRKRISERIMEQIVDTVSCGSLPGSSSSHSPAGDEERADEPGEGFFRTFPQIKKKVRRSLRTRGRNCLRTPAHGRQRLSWRTLLSGCGSGRSTLARRTSGTDVLTVQSGVLQLASMSCGTAKRMRREGSGTGTGTRVSPRLSSLLFLLGEEQYRQPRAVYKYWARMKFFHSFVPGSHCSVLVLPEVYRFMDFSGRRLLVFRIQFSLVRLWLHVWRQFMRLFGIISHIYVFDTKHTIYELCLPSERGFGMCMDLAVPVSSGKYSGTFVFTAPVAEPTLVSFTVPLVG